MSDLQKALKTLCETQASMMNSHNQAINRLEVQISQLAHLMKDKMKHYQVIHCLIQRTPFPLMKPRTSDGQGSM